MSKGSGAPTEYTTMSVAQWKRIYEIEAQNAVAARIEATRLRNVLKDLRDTINAGLERER